MRWRLLGPWPTKAPQLSCKKSITRANVVVMGKMKKPTAICLGSYVNRPKIVDNGWLARHRFRLSVSWPDRDFSRGDRAKGADECKLNLTNAEHCEHLPLKLSKGKAVKAF